MDFLTQIARKRNVDYRIPMTKSVPSLSRTQQVYEQIRTQILNGHLTSGKKLVISEINQRFSANQSAVREALSRLTSEGLVDAEPQRGFRVAPMAAEDLHHLTEVRLLIEGPCVASAIAHATIAWEQAIVSELHGLLRTPRYDCDGNVTQEWADAHHGFHRALVATCDNPWLLRVRQTLMLQSERYRWFSISTPDKRRNLEKEYTRIAEAFLARSVNAATKLMCDHIRTTAEIVLRADISATSPLAQKASSSR